LTLYPPATFDPVAAGATAQQQMQVDDGIPRVDGRCEGVVGHFLIDTGSFSTVFFQGYAGRLPRVVQERAKDEDDMIQSGGLTVGGALPEYVADVTSFEFGSAAFNSVAVTVPETSWWNISEYDGVVGRNILAYFAFYLDYQNKMVYFKPSQKQWIPKS
jgi:hypothetical protein